MTRKHPLRNIDPALRRRRAIGCIVTVVVLLLVGLGLAELMFGLFSIMWFGSGWS